MSSCRRLRIDAAGVEFQARDFDGVHAKVRISIPTSYYKLNWVCLKAQTLRTADVSLMIYFDPCFSRYHLLRNKLLSVRHMDYPTHG